MALDLQRISILVVEDSQFIRSILSHSLKAMGVGQVSMAEDGSRAIEFLQLVAKDPMRAGVMSVDIVLTNWDMSPVDGIMLLKWIRRHKDSPDRFLPVLMLTAYTERHRVKEARDLGANEVLSKPFSLNSLSDKLLGVITRQRQFIHSKDFFGPDRRRQAVRYEGPERRILTEKSPGVQVVNV